MTKKVYGVFLVLVIALAMAFSGCTDTSGEEQKSVETITIETTTTYIVGIDGEYPPYA